MVNPDGSTGDEVPLFDGENVVGRESEFEVLSRDPFLSPEHACFTVRGAEVFVRDLESLNGVYYRIAEVTELSHADQIRIGQEVLQYFHLDADDAMIPPATDGTVTAGAPPQAAWGRLERKSTPESASFAFLLRGPEVSLGREIGDIVFRDDGYVSGRHMRLFRDGDRTFAEDLRSSNGTFLRIREERKLKDGALILMGKQPFRLVLGG